MYLTSDKIEMKNFSCKIILHESRLNILVEFHTQSIQKKNNLIADFFHSCFLEIEIKSFL